MGAGKYIAWLVVLIAVLAFGNPVFAASAITLDGSFDDWEGQAYITDPPKDGNDFGDIVKFSWATNDNDSNLYFMIERTGEDKLNILTHFQLYFDINDNGNYKDKGDYYLIVHYAPAFNGLVDLYLHKQKGGLVSKYYGYWGENAWEGGRRLEFKVDMEKMGMSPGQPIRMYVESTIGKGDRCPDSGDIQWSPIPIMPLWALIIIFLAALATGTYFIRKRMKT
jgi:hypothetical protein